MRTVFVLLALFFCSCAQKPGEVSLFPSELLSGLKSAYINGDKIAVEAVNQFEDEAARYLRMEPLYVTEKSIVPPSGDKRDYMTLSPYWWPDPEKEGGLPYVRRDGERNPEVYNYPERENTNLLGEAVRALALLYHVTGSEDYAKKCSELIREWFSNPERGMNPNMNYAQGIPGRAAGRGAGIIDARRFSYAVAVVPLLRGSMFWSKEDDKAIRKWSEEFLKWMAESENGQKELMAKNNHGLWYDAIRLMHLLNLERRDEMVEVVKSSLLPRLDSQIAEDGSLPKELERTLSLHYSTFALEAIAVAGSLTEFADESVWSYRTSDGRSLEQVLEYLAPYYENPDKWPFTQIKPFEKERGAQILYLAGSALGREDWIELSKRIGLKGEELDLNSLLYFNL